MVWSLRHEAGLTQRELARRVGTGAAVICRLERDEYRGAGLAMLRRVAGAVGKRVEVRVVPAAETSLETMSGAVGRAHHYETDRAWALPQASISSTATSFS